MAREPRADCKEHGVHQVKVPWAGPGSRFTAMFEALAIDGLKETGISGVGRLLDLTWRQVDGIMNRAVTRGLARRKLELPTQMGVDETSFQKRHEYVTVVCDLVRNVVVHVAGGRTKESLGQFCRQFSQEELASIDTIAMDMCAAFIAVTRERVPEADEKIAFDKFHVAAHLSDAVDKVRRAENARLKRNGDDALKGTRYLWLSNPAKPERCTGGGPGGPHARGETHGSRLGAQAARCGTLGLQGPVGGATSMAPLVRARHSLATRAREEGSPARHGAPQRHPQRGHHRHDECEGGRHQLRRPVGQGNNLPMPKSPSRPGTFVHYDGHISRSESA